MNAPDNTVDAPSANRPASYPRRMLLAVVGTSPQILTETLYALTQREDAFVPTDIRVITTEEGARQIESRLLDENDGAFHTFCRDYGLEGQIAFDVSHITRIKQPNGEPMEDVRTPEDNARTADEIVNWVRHFSQDPLSALHVSLAGGRKTMGFFLGYALSLFGRQQDRLSHVLVSAPFDTFNDFYYPPRKPVILRRQIERGELTARTSDARIYLAEIPFVRLRDGLPEDIRKGSANFSSVVEAAQRTIGPTGIRIDLRRGTLHCGGKLVEMPPQHFAFYAWHARRRKQLGDAAHTSPKSRDPIHREFLDVYLEVLDGDDADPAYLAACHLHKDGFDSDSWMQIKSRIKKALRHTLGATNAEPYVFEEVKRGNSKHMTIAMPPELIEFVEK